MQLSPKTFLTAAIALILLFGAARADDWPQWRGPDRDSAYHETGLLESFPAEGLNVRWRVPVGWGWSSPVVAQGRVYVADSVVVQPKAKERIQCFDESTGNQLWTHEYEVDYPDWAFDPAQQIGPVATPIADSGKVYALGRTNLLFCLDARSGDVLWQKNLERDYQAAHGAGAPSPLIDGDLLILFVGGKPAACVIALNKDTGNEVWKALDESLTFSSPIVIDAGGKRQLIVWTQESVTSLEPASGRIHWRQRLLTSGDYAVSTPVYYKDRLLIGGLMFELDSQQPGAKVLWPASRVPSRRIFSHTSTALFRGDHVFSAKSSGELICVETSTGKQVWESTAVTDRINGASIHLTVNGDSVLLYTDRGELIRAQLTPEGYKEISRVALLEPTFPFAGRSVAWSPPAYANRHIFARNSKELICASLAQQQKDSTRSEQETLLKKLATPGEQHRHFDSLAGKWKLAVKWRTTPDAKWTESVGVAQYKWILGGRFLLEEFKYDMGEDPLEWLGIYGYDNFQKKYTAIWVDNVGTNTEFAEAQYDSKAKVFSYIGEQDDPTTGGKRKFRWVITIENQNSVRFDSYDQDSSGQYFKNTDVLGTRIGGAK